MASVEELVRDGEDPDGLTSGKTRLIFHSDWPSTWCHMQFARVTVKRSVESGNPAVDQMDRMSGPKRLLMQGHIPTRQVFAGLSEKMTMIWGYSLSPKTSF